MLALLRDKVSRRSLLHALLALPALRLVRNVEAGPQPDAIVEVGGWILKRSDLA